MAETTKLTLAVDTTQVLKAKEALDEFSKSGKGSEKVSEQLKAALDDLQRQAALLNEGLKQSGRQTKSGTTEFNKYGKSVKETAAALRQVPAQLTDIVVGLQAGQSPLTVLLQQGGQLRDTFGGIAPAAKALGGAVVGLINPFTIAGAAALALGAAYNQGSKEADNFAKALILTGNASGTTVNALTQMAQRIDGITGTQAKASEALAAFAANGNIAAGNLERFATAAIRVESLVGAAIGDTVKEFEQLGKAPLAASIKLNEATNFLTDSIYEQIKALEEQGKTAEAANVAQVAYAAELERRLDRVQERLGYVERAWRFVKNGAAEAWDEMLGIGRPDGLGDLENRLRTLQALSRIDPSRQSSPTAQAEIENLRQQIYNEGELERITRRSAETQKTRNDQLKSKIEFDKQGQRYLSDAVNLERDLAQARELGIRAGLTQGEIEKRLNQIREDYAKKQRKPRDTTRIDTLAALRLEVAGIQNASEQLISAYENEGKILEAQRSAGLISERAYYDLRKQLIDQNAKVQIDALQQEIEALQKVSLTTKDNLDLKRQIADNESEIARIRARQTTDQTILEIRESSAIAAKAKALLEARQAAEAYFQTLQRSLQREEAAFGMSNREREMSRGLQQIEDRYNAQRVELENQAAALKLEGKFTEESRAYYEERLRIIAEYQNKAVQLYTDSFNRQTQAQQVWQTGAIVGLKNYYEETQKVADQVQNAFTNAFKGLEDALTDFVTTGKLDFKSLANSIVADITRIIIRTQITGPLANWLLGQSGGGGILGGVFGSGGGIFNFSGRAIGGQVSAGNMYRVNERRPELLSIGGQEYLMMGNQGGKVKDTGMSSGNVTIINISVPVPNQNQRATALQFGRDVAKQLQVATLRNG